MKKKKAKKTKMPDTVKKHPGRGKAVPKLAPYEILTYQGVFSLRTGMRELLPPIRPIPPKIHSYRNAGTTAPVWQAALLEMFDYDMVAVQMVQKMFGYMLVPGNPDRVIFALSSVLPRAGKQLIADILTAVLQFGNPEQTGVLISGYGGLICVGSPALETDAITKKLMLLHAETYSDSAYHSEIVSSQWKETVIPISLPCCFERNCEKRFWYQREDNTMLTRHLLQHEIPGIFKWAIQGAVRWYAESFREKGSDRLKFPNESYQFYHDPVFQMVYHKHRMRCITSGEYPKLSEIRADYQLAAQIPADTASPNLKAAFNGLGYMCHPRMDVVRFKTRDYPHAELDATYAAKAVRVKYNVPLNHHNFKLINCVSSNLLIKVWDLLLESAASMKKQIPSETMQLLYSDFCAGHFAEDYLETPESFAVFSTAMKFLGHETF